MSKAHHAGEARRACFFISLRSLDPDANSVTKIPGHGFGPDILERGLPEASKTGLLIGELEPVAERVAAHHFKETRRVPLLDMMKQHLAGEAEVSALAQRVERFVLRPYLEVLSQPSLADKLQ